MRNIIPVRYIEEGGMVPMGFGVSWDDFMRKRVVCHPIGINYLASMCLWLFICVRFPFTRRYMTRRDSVLIAEVTKHQRERIKELESENNSLRYRSGAV